MEENGEKEKIHAPSVNLSKIKDEPLSDDEKTNICVRPWAEGALFVSTNEEMANKPICQMEQKDNGLCSVASVTLPLTKIKEEPCSDGYSMPNNTQTNKEHIMTNYSGEPLKEEQVEPIPPEDTSFEDVYMKEEESILDDNHSQEQSSDEEMFFNSDSQEEPCKLNNDGSGPSKATQEVYIKEEFDTDMEGSEDNVTELTNHNRMPDHGFGNHFLTQCLEPREPRYQYANGQSAEEVENGTFVDDILSSNSKDNAFCDEEKDSNNLIIDKDGFVQTSNPVTADLYDKPSKKRYRSRLVPVRRHPKGQPRQSTKPPVKCSFCDYDAPNNWTLHAHVLKKHNFGNEPIDCPYCKYMSLSLLEIQDHIVKKHKTPRGKTHYCPLCEYKTCSTTNLRYHMCAKHTGEKKFACPVCSYRCILPSDLSRHTLKMHNKRCSISYCIRYFSIVPNHNDTS